MISTSSTISTSPPPSQAPFVLSALAVLFAFLSMLSSDLSSSSPTGNPSTFLQGWNYVGTSSSVRLYNRPHPSGSLAVRGVSTISVGMDKVMSTFFDVPGSLNWVQDLREVQEIKFDKRNLGGTIRQRYRVKAAMGVVKDREFVVDRAVRVDRRGKKVEVTYKSNKGKEAERLCKGCVRAETERTKWEFYKCGEDGEITCVDLEAVIDPGGGLPKVLVDFIQRKW
eukprot:CAMPEP_0118650180 /NCGR_PEP_ID=MMETSP0785-20121206/10108_1 /TAXON_ID=91992 /ORGANISM="Bolidomonas pacifica, Strain CCMP 1866" /LENGTH=224 /DNA_ID=CAMNT_0006542535 /DNA_START=59 /DNA_END=730 /DNA_ORIENTATION=+